MRKHLVVLFPLVVLLALFHGGCALAPGSYLQEKDQDALEYPVIFYTITPALLAAQSASLSKSSTNRFQRAQDDNRTHYDYCVGPGDILSITVWDHPELTIPAGSQRSAQEAGNWVHSNGEIFYPYIGSIKVEGLNVAQIRDLIAERLAKYIERPQVDVTVAAFRSQRVYVTGEVKAPGVLPVTNVPLTLVEAINSVGGLTDRANWDAVTVQREGKEKRFSLRRLFQLGDASQNIVLYHNDLIHVEQDDYNKVFVLGEVRKPMSYSVGRHGLTLAEALAEAGGLFESTADASGVFVLRRSEAGMDAGEDALAEVYQLNVRNATALVLAEQFRLWPRDIVYVTAAPVTRWNRVINQLLPSVSGLYSIGRLHSELAD